MNSLESWLLNLRGARLIPHAESCSRSNLEGASAAGLPYVGTLSNQRRTIADSICMKFKDVQRMDSLSFVGCVCTEDAPHGLVPLSRCQHSPAKNQREDQTARQTLFCTGHSIIRHQTVTVVMLQLRTDRILFASRARSGFCILISILST